LIALLTSLYTIRRLIVYAATSIACSCSAFCGGDGEGVAGVEDLPNKEAKDEERREELVCEGARCPGLGGRGGLVTTCGGRGSECVCAGKVKVG
jgi:hypothetical protein